MIFPGTRPVLQVRRAMEWLRAVVLPHGPSLGATVLGSLLGLAAAVVCAQAPAPAPAPAQAAASAALTMRLQAADLPTVLRGFGSLVGKSVSIGPGVAGKVTMELVGVPWQEALDWLAQDHGLEIEHHPTVLRVRARAQRLEERQTVGERARKWQELEPLQHRIWTLEHLRADEFVRTLLATGGASASAQGGTGSGGASGSGTRLLSPRGTATALARSNHVVVMDTAARLDAIGDWLRMADRPVRQVFIEARIVEAADTFARSLGVKLQGRTRQATSGMPLEAVGLFGVEPVTWALQMVWGPAAARLLELELSALEAEGQGRVVSSPRIVTTDQVEAHVKQGFRVPYRGSATPQQGPPPVQFQEANLRLAVTPHIAPGGRVLLNVVVNKDTLGAITPDGREINTKEIRTQVLLENGGTAIVGGIYENEASDSRAGVPGLSHWPGVGALFRRTARDHRRTELLIFLTPRVLELPLVQTPADPP